MPNTIDFSEKTILIVEDDATNMELLEAMLSPTNAIIIGTEFGKEALKIVQQQKIDIVLMDIRLPDSNGLEITAEIKKHFPNLPVIAQTAFADIENKEKALFSGCNDFMAKPIYQDSLFEILKTWI